MTKVTFENATIRDVIGKAARVAPTKGSAFDKAAGILMEIDADRQEIVVRATNLEVFYMEVTDPVSIEGSSTTWRIPSQILDGICSKLPIASGRTVTFDDNEGKLKIAAGRMRANVRLVDASYFPTWEAFDENSVSPVEDFGSRLQQIEWAASRNGSPPLTGVHLDGEYAIATDQYRVGITPCAIETLNRPVTIPARIFTPLMKNLGSVSIGTDASHLLVMPDEATQIRAVIYGQDYPNVMGIFKRNETDTILVRKEFVLDMIDRAMVMGQTDRTPLLKMIIGEQELAVMMEDREIGLLGDVLEVPGMAVHDRHYIGFTPENLKSALEAAPSEEVGIYYTNGQSMKPVRIDGGSGYESLIMPRKIDGGD